MGRLGGCKNWGYGLEGTGFNFRQGFGIFLFSEIFSPAMGPAQPFVYWVLEVRWPGSEGDSSFLLVQSLIPCCVCLCVAWAGTNIPFFFSLSNSLMLASVRTAYFHTTVW